MEGKEQAAVAMFEQWVAAHPDFWEGHFWLGAAHESVARATFTSPTRDATATRARHFAAAAVNMRRGLQLAGPGAPFDLMRSLIDLHGVIGLNQPAEYERLVRDAVARYPAEPHAHAYLLEILATKGESIEAAATAFLPADRHARSPSSRDRWKGSRGRPFAWMRTAISPA